MRMRGVTDPYEVAEKFLARHRNWSNGYGISREQEPCIKREVDVPEKGGPAPRPGACRCWEGLRNEYPSMRLSRPLTRRFRPHRIPTSPGS